MTEKIRKLIEAAKNKETNVLPEHKDFWSDSYFLKKLHRSLNRKTSDTNLADTKLAAITQDPEIFDRQKFAEQMRITGCKTKKEYVRYMMRLHAGKTRSGAK